MKIKVRSPKTDAQSVTFQDMRPGVLYRLVLFPDDIYVKSFPGPTDGKSHLIQIAAGEQSAAAPFVCTTVSNTLRYIPLDLDEAVIFQNEEKDL